MMLAIERLGACGRTEQLSAAQAPRQGMAVNALGTLNAGGAADDVERPAEAVPAQSLVAA
jgi:hypothetical protein